MLKVNGGQSLARLTARAQGEELTNSHVGIRPSYFHTLPFWG